MTTPALARGYADLSRHRRCACSVPKIQVGQRGIWTGVFQVSIRRDRLERQRYHAAEMKKQWTMLYRGGPGRADPHQQVVVAQGLGDADRQARGMKKAIVALARRLAVILHRIWVGGTEFRSGPGNRP